MPLDKTAQLEPTLPLFPTDTPRIPFPVAGSSTHDTKTTEGSTNASISASSTNTTPPSIHSTQSGAIFTSARSQTEEPVGSSTGSRPSTSSSQATSLRVTPPAIPTPTPRISLTFTQILPSVIYTKACTSTIVGWAYNGPQTGALITLAAFVPGTDTIAHVVATDVDAATELFVWRDVDLLPGSYVMKASGSTISASSDLFTVAGGEDPSCGEPGYSSLRSSRVASPELATTSTTSTPSISSLSSAPAFSMTQSSAAAGWPQPTTTPLPAKAGLIAGSVVGCMFLLVMSILAYVCLRASVWRRVRTSLPPSRGHGGYPTARWFGLSSTDITMQAGSVDEKSPLASTEVPRPALPQLQPNRLRLSTSFEEQVSAGVAPCPQRDSLSMNAIARANSITRGRDSPTSPASPYRRRKPVPLLTLPPKTTMGPAPVTQDAQTPDGDSPGPNSAVPSSATSRMYRVRDSGTSTQTRGGESGRTRASSMIDPGQFGAMKTMHSVIPDVPPMPTQTES
ncbi:hypothetical protein C8Q78DRAFT_1076255 [Trametes maxima]|nr:hypothetical protein C8Q78DRAFT_1076255 [Trametes maxima]